MWKGPSVDGVTQSLINRFLQCPFAAYIYLILGLQEEEEPQPNLIWGDCFHKGLELFIPSRDFPSAVQGMLEYLEEEYPYAPSTFKLSLPKMLRIYKLKEFEGDWITEQVIDQEVCIDGTWIRFRGKRDGITHNHPQYGQVLAEHKCKGFIDPSLCKDELPEDLQLNVYLKLDNTEWVFYDLIKIPDTQKYGPGKAAFESSKDYIERIYHGPMGSYGGKYPIYSNKAEWINQGIYFLPQEKQEEYWDRTIIPIVKRICNWYDWVTQSGFDHENPKYYNDLFYKMPIRHFDGRKTESFKCNYHSYLTGQTLLTDLQPVTSYFHELDNA